ncbi:LOW QUALITY PROTEIN: protein phosphatase 1 regulatory subunit 12C, partial [Myiozetetes cayanensis]|uniref:LOW QUALITY PROTEIN: protein phosphatase 1 regulatory subunit 12C n=1 Tax=Myiozetetes cayanensis TaxID=478635 RepID=UPI002160679E
AAAAAAAQERRREQLRRWEEAVAAAAAANPPVPAGPPRPPQVRFERAAEFRAVCAGAELAEARAMVRAGGRALLGGANADGISALHQACIDENMEVVQFLVESGADVNQADNEGWTPLHVAAACGCRHIAQYLLEHGADAAAVTSDLELPLEVAEDEGLEELLRAELERRGVDIVAAKRAEEERMLRDTRLWLDSGQLRDCPHPATGASALHVAAAKGYIEVMRLLLAAGYDPDVRDKDGWTPLHAAAHWGVEEACRLLAEHLCDMAPRNNVGQRPCDLADEETLPLLEELQRRQHHLRSQKDRGSSPPDPDGAPSLLGGKHRRAPCRRSFREKLSVQDQAKESADPPSPDPPAAPPAKNHALNGPSLHGSGSLGALPTLRGHAPAKATPPCAAPPPSPRLQAPAHRFGPHVPLPSAPGPRQRRTRGPRSRRARPRRSELKAAEQVIGRAGEGRGPEQPIRDEGRRDPAGPAAPRPPVQVNKGGCPRAQRPNGPQGLLPQSRPQPPMGCDPQLSPAFDYQQLFQELWVENERIREQLQEAELALTQTRLELERVTQRQERGAGPARLELERFERRALELKAAELEEELKALSDLRPANQRLEDEKQALIRVISKLSK